jgi:hypothetical protein
MGVDNIEHDRSQISRNEDVAGFVRAIVKPFKMNKLPVINKRALAKGIDNISTAIDVSVEVKKVEGSDNDAESKQKSNDVRRHESRIKWLVGKGTQYVRLLLHAIPGMAKSTMIGTASFATYGELCDRYPEHGDPLSPLKTAIVSAGFGACAGTVHGLLFNIWYSIQIARISLIYTSHLTYALSFFSGIPPLFLLAAIST